MRQAKIYYNTLFSDLLTETNDGDFTFKYETEYVNKYTGNFITFTMPVRVQEYKSTRVQRKAFVCFFLKA
ncbi:HipA N-terminal domain-containing protein [Lacinutrix sp. Bg11-31]|uniref:HipA N-terminal domain-containing protein n=1 Tax=Lacinutrix sp. Bg11-31 TaxID=2057808 RepID=UPI0035108B51